MNFPGSWLNFSEYKEIKQLRMALTETISLRIQITVSIIIAIVTLSFSGEISELDLCYKVLIILGICFLVVVIFLWPLFQKYYKFMKTNNVMLDGKKAINIFDDEIVYDIMIATEFKKLMVAEKNIGLKTFYQAEMTYYVKKSMENLNMMSSSYIKIFGEGGQQVSVERVRNINTIINELLSECAEIDETITVNYGTFTQNIDAL
ncbi:MAG: hypothetical protein NC313_03545 [Butyrivibrio sp.]|nr:hypothetical protein [Butyrivibrio sp.]